MMRKPHQLFWTIAMLVVVGSTTALEDSGTTTTCNNETGTCEASDPNGNDGDNVDAGLNDQYQQQATANAYQYYQQHVVNNGGTGSHVYQYHVDTMYQTHSYQTPPPDNNNYFTQTMMTPQADTVYPDDYDNGANFSGSSTTQQQQYQQHQQQKMLYPSENYVYNPYHTTATTHDANHGNDESCVDKDVSCDAWAKTGECENNSQYMALNCQKSCKLCTPVVPSHGEDLGVAQIMTDADGTKQEDIHFLLHKARSYMRYVVPKQFDTDMATICTNRYDMCAMWALDGWCDTHSEWMHRDCGPLCGTCKVHTIEDRCPVDLEAPNAWEPGDLNRLFMKLSSEPYLSQYEVDVLSSPDTTGGPWVITMENVVTEEEAKRFIELGNQQGFQRSTDVGKVNADGTFQKNVSQGRTSTNTWCYDTCREDELIRQVIERMDDMTGIPDPNAENLQLLKYEQDQFYHVHHDYIPFQRDRQEGCRILTAYLYLSDVELGGGTRFDKLDLTVLPKRGRMLLWPSVLDESPHDIDDRTTHTALPVEEGIKYGANAWFHQRDFKTPNKQGCA